MVLGAGSRAPAMILCHLVASISLTPQGQRRSHPPPRRCVQGCISMHRDRPRRDPCPVPPAASARHAPFDVKLSAAKNCRRAATAGRASRTWGTSPGPVAYRPHHLGPYHPGPAPSRSKLAKLSFKPPKWAPQASWPSTAPQRHHSSLKKRSEELA